MLGNDKGGMPAPLLRALAYERARLMMRSIIESCPTESPLLQKYADDMKTCGNLMLLRSYYETGTLRCVAASSCKHRVCCPLCAVRTARKNAGELANKLSGFIGQPFQLVTITQPDIPDYSAAVDSMVLTHKRFMKAWRNGCTRLTMESFFNHYLGGYYSIEVKAGKGSGMAHPHIHYLMHGKALTTSEHVKNGHLPETHPLAVELRKRNPLGGYICDVRDIDADTDEALILSLMEVCKYVHDFKVSPSDVWTIQQAIYRRRMTGSFGTLRGLKLNNQPDDIIDPREAGRFVEYILQWTGAEYDMQEGCYVSYEDKLYSEKSA